MMSRTERRGTVKTRGEIAEAHLKELVDAAWVPLRSVVKVISSKYPSPERVWWLVTRGIARDSSEYTLQKRGRSLMVRRSYME